ncbi:hypothetical protein [Erythrobacter sp.]|jgi:hypothetical protein|uniref:hypothetical protein n=1 Tax=Erythrobacter sp. TaxID=1042 RepID=UPI002EA21008|nr:hypothetical protein [Erythrobacter sp.]
MFEGVRTISQVSVSGKGGLFLLFAQGSRPDSAAIRGFVGGDPALAISFDPAEAHLPDPVNDSGALAQKERQARGDTAHAPVWLELLRDGLSFDLAGLAPGPAPRLPTIEHRFDLADAPIEGRYDVLHLAPGHHLAGGENTLPVARSLVALARDLVRHFETLEVVVWPPASSAIGRRFFESTTTAWLEGGPFPALGLTAFRETMDGALQSEGLGFWIGQELRIEPPLSRDQVAATRMAVRLVNQLLLVNGIKTSERVVAPDGNPLLMKTSRNGKFVRVWRE